MGAVQMGTSEYTWTPRRVIPSKVGRLSSRRRSGSMFYSERRHKWIPAFAGMTLDHLDRRLHALMWPLAAFYLDSCVTDAEALAQFLASADQHRVIIADGRFHEVCGESDVCCAHPPDVQVVNVGHVGYGTEIGFYFSQIYAFRHGIECEMQRLPEQTPCTHGYYNNDQKTHDWIYPEPSRDTDYDAGNHYAK